MYEKVIEPSNKVWMRPKNCLRLAAAALIQSLAWELLYTAGAALERPKEKKRERENCLKENTGVNKLKGRSGKQIWEAV